MRADGLKEAFRQTGLRLCLRAEDSLPLARINRAGVFAPDTKALMAEDKGAIRASSLMIDASQVEKTYPLVFEWRQRILRYAFIPAEQESRGLVVLFHGHNAFLHMGPLKAWKSFDLLAPWDTFGWKRQGSWFWGEKSDNFVEQMVQALIAKQRQQAPGKPWFCTGGSMGGFGALYHGFKYASDGVYVMCPQVDLEAKIKDYGGDVADNPYAYLRGEKRGDFPDLLAEADAKPSLPPLYLVQNLRDYVNPFAEHAYRLLDIYHRKDGWYGLRVHPSVGHGGDGNQEEAELFFTMILDKKDEFDDT